MNKEVNPQVLHKVKQLSKISYDERKLNIHNIKQLLICFNPTLIPELIYKLMVEFRQVVRAYSDLQEWAFKVSDNYDNLECDLKRICEENNDLIAQLSEYEHENAELIEVLHMYYDTYEDVYGNIIEDGE